MDEKRLSVKVCRDLKRLMKSRKIPQKRLAPLWGISKSKVSERLNLKLSPPHIDHIDSALDLLGIDIEDFFAGIQTGFHPELTLRDFLQEHPKQFPQFCERRLRKPSERAYELDELVELADGLESLRFVDPTAALRQAVDVLRFLGPRAIQPAFTQKMDGDLNDDMADLAADVWGVLGIVQRHRGQTSTAAGAYLSALRLGRSLVVKARTLQRIAMLLHLNSEDQESALLAVRLARRNYLDAADDSGVGKTFVDEAAISCLSGDYRRARQLNTRALVYLTAGDVENRFAAVQGVATASVFLEDMATAATSLDQAIATLPQSRPLLAFSLHWLRGEVALAAHQTGTALDHLSKTLDAAEDAELAPSEVVLVHLRMAKAYHLQGDRYAMRATLYGLMPFQAKLRRWKVLHAVLSEFLSNALEDDAAFVTAEKLELVYRRMREGMTAAPATVIPPVLAT